MKKNTSSYVPLYSKTDLKFPTNLKLAAWNVPSIRNSCVLLDVVLFWAHFSLRLVTLILQIHPSSALKYSDITPEFIVYECSVHTSNDFVLNVCAADSSWLHEIDQNVLEEGRKVCPFFMLVEYTIFYQINIENWGRRHIFLSSSWSILFLSMSKSNSYQKIWYRFSNPYKLYSANFQVFHNAIFRF